MNDLKLKSPNRPAGNDEPPTSDRFDGRRRLLVGTGAAAAAVGLGNFAWRKSERFWRASTFVARAECYDDRLSTLILAGLQELGVDRGTVRGKSVLLKPNLVEPSIEAPHINTHPAVVRAAAEAFRRLDAAEVIVAEGQGHIRDAWYVLEQSGLEPELRDAGLSFVDLNHDDVYSVANRQRLTEMDELHLPQSLRRADLVVSLPKMKVHHWAGVTLSMKNLFGVMPGICYGWPKNVLHHMGIGRSILDINAAVKPDLAIVDGIVGMEGDGPIMGTPRHAGLLVMGSNLPAVDATACRLMGFDPRKIEHLHLASGRLGPIHSSHIEQRGETLADCTQPFRLDDHPHFDRFR